MTPGELVTGFIGALEARELDAALGFVADDVVYDNVPMGPVTGPDGIRAALTPFLSGCDEVEWVVHHQVESGDLHAGTVMNERTDRFRTGTRWAEVPVAGLFVVRAGRIILWRDYFDLPTATAALRP
jgi:limonene-1,2-epoxide hydrolase